MIFQIIGLIIFFFVTSNILNNYVFYFFIFIKFVIVIYKCFKFLFLKIGKKKIIFEYIFLSNNNKLKILEYKKKWNRENIILLSNILINYMKKIKRKEWKKKSKNKYLNRSNALAWQTKWANTRGCHGVRAMGQHNNIIELCYFLAFFA